MAEGASFNWWNHTAAIQATLGNTVRDPKKKKKPFAAREFHPHLIHAERLRRKREGRPARQKIPISALKSVFVEGASVDKLLEEHGIEDAE